MRFSAICLIFTAACSLAVPAMACTVDPTRDFFANFDNDCYAVRPATGNGENWAGDLHADYDVLSFRTDPNYELIVYGNYPQARYFSLTIYDDHVAPLATLYDMQIVPLTAGGQNPYLPGGRWTAGQRWAAVIGFGGQQPPAQQVTPGCSLTGLNAHANPLKGFGRHAGITWTGDPNLPSRFPEHSTAPTVGGTIIVRRYMEDRSHPEPSKFLVRDLRTGCAVPADQAWGNFVSTSILKRKQWANNKEQEDAHSQYARDIQQEMCYGPDPSNVLYWTRNAEYVKGINEQAAYLFATVTSEVRSQVHSLTQHNYLRLRLRMPRMPRLPCPDCTLTGNEQLRYWSLSFMNGLKTVYTINDSQVVQDANGYATIVVGVGEPPAQVTAANGYTYIDAGSGLLAGFNVDLLALRSILPAPGASCVANRIAFRRSEHNGAGGFMGEYALKSDIVEAAGLPATAQAYQEPDTCDLPAPEAPQACSVYFPTGWKVLSLPGLSILQ